MSKSVLLTLDQGVATITLNRPEACNAFDRQMLNDFIATLQDVNEDPRCHAVVFKGTGKHFCAGGDIKLMQAKEQMFAGDVLELQENYRKTFQKIGRTFTEMQKPCIAMIEGAAVGAGLGITLHCDFRFSLESAFFAANFIKIGLLPGDGSFFLLRKIVGETHAREMLFTGKNYSASQAQKMGLLNDFFKTPAELEKNILTLTDTLKSYSLEALKLLKKSLNQNFYRDYSLALDYAALAQGVVQNLPEHFSHLKK